MKFKNTAKLLRRLRKERRISQNKVARLIGFNGGQFVSNWERGISAPSKKRIGCVAALYRVPSTVIVDAWLEDKRQHMVAREKQ